MATKARDDMLAIVAHDLRNPLNTIYMSSQLLLEIVSETEHPTEHRQLAIVMRAATRMNGLIQDLLEVKRIESGNLVLDRRQTDAATIIAEALDILRPIAAASSLSLESDIALDVPLITVDSSRIQQVLSNLVGNAIKFTPAGGHIVLRALPADGEACFIVVDTGPGIAPDALPRIFEPFFTTKPPGEGSGLGLGIAQRIVEKHGGRIEVESRPGRTSFTVLLPTQGPQRRPGDGSPDAGVKDAAG